MQILNRLRRREPEETISGEVTLIVGLGNPGREYASHRHNVGFQIADRYAAAHGLTFSKIQSKAIIASGRVDAVRMILAKPQTFMNDSGRAVGALINFYKIPQQRMLVIFDDLDLPYGSVRLRAEGGAGGHNGMRSIIQHLGSNQFPRLRIGIGRPPGRMNPAAFVLQDFGREEQAEFDSISDRAVKAINTFINSGITTAMNQFNTAGEKREP